MLVLSRLEGEVIRIGDDIVITVLQVDTRVTLGIDAPKNIRIIRAETLPDTPDEDANSDAA